MKMVSSNWNEQRIQIPGRMTFLPYYTSSPWGKNEAYFIFYSALPDFSRVWLHTWSPDEGRITAEFELTAWNGLDGLLVSELLLSAVLLPEQRRLLLPLREKLYSVSVDDGRAEMVWALPDASLRLGGPGNRSKDGGFVVFGAFPLPPGAPQNVPLTVLDTATFKPAGSYEFDGFFANHFQFMSDPDWILFAHEGPTEGIPDRLNRLNWRTGERQTLHRHATGPDGKLQECIGHEMTAGETVCAVRYPVSVLPGALITMNLDGSGCGALDCDDYWHSSCNADGTVFAMDTMWWGSTKRKTPLEMDIIRIDRKAGTKEIVKTIHSDPKQQYRHPHPQLNATGNRLLFIENSDTDGTLGSITLRTLA